MPKRLTKFKKVSIGLKGVEHVAQHFSCCNGMVYKALRGDTSKLSMEIQDYVELNKQFFKKNFTYQYQTVYLY